VSWAARLSILSTSTIL